MPKKKMGMKYKKGTAAYDKKYGKGGKMKMMKGKKYKQEEGYLCLIRKINQEI